MIIIDLSKENSILNNFIREIRDVEIQHDRMRFNKNMSRIGQILGYEVSKLLSFSTTTIQTPLKETCESVIKEPIVLGTILRAGLSLHYGLFSFFDKADCAFVSAYRKYKDTLKFEINIEYIASPDLNQKTLIISDPMLATGSSMELAYKALLTNGIPSRTFFLSIISSQEAIKYLQEIFVNDDNITLIVARIDPELNEHSYIVPGLGDAGDLAFGHKI